MSKEYDINGKLTRISSCPCNTLGTTLRKLTRAALRVLMDFLRFNTIIGIFVSNITMA